MKYFNFLFSLITIIIKCLPCIACRKIINSQFFCQYKAALCFLLFGLSHSSALRNLNLLSRWSNKVSFVIVKTFFSFLLLPNNQENSSSVDSFRHCEDQRKQKLLFLWSKEENILFGCVVPNLSDNFFLRQIINF